MDVTIELYRLPKAMKKSKQESYFGHPTKSTESETANFNIDCFWKEHFHVDRFVAECKDKVPLHILREDLEGHYKNIRLALIDLINKDYADFVSLSSNLVGMEQSIENLRKPLGKIREEFQTIKKRVCNELDSIEDKLSRRRDTREKKTQMQHLLNATSSVEKIEKIILDDPGCKEMKRLLRGNRESVGQFLERVAGEFNQLQFHVNQSKGHPLVNLIRPRVSLITSKLQESLEATFHKGLDSNQSDLVLRCLRTYALINKTGHAEDLFRHDFVKPRLQSIISEENYNEKGLIGTCREIIEFINSDCQLLLMLTAEKPSNCSTEKNKDGVKGFDFLVNAIWPEVDHGFETRLAFVFSPGNPNAFFERYKISMEFLEEFETMCISLDSFKRLQDHTGYQSFLAKWSLPVYFQIRLQEIVGCIEACLDYPFSILKDSSNIFTTNLIETFWSQLNKCWDVQVFLPPLTSRFWKLFLQIISRLVTFLKEVSEGLEPSDKDINSECVGKPESEVVPSSKYEIIFLGRLFGDLDKLGPQVCTLYERTVSPVLFKICEDSLKQHEATFKECLENMSKCTENMSSYIVKCLAASCAQPLENTKNIPRLYRRTNREQPLQSSDYIKLAFSPLKHFYDSVSKSIESTKLVKILQQTVFTVTARYYVIVYDLVASIKKTEESLQRLKRLRKGVESISQLTAANDVSDENKIRRQLLLDVEQFGKEMEHFSRGPAELCEEYSQLKDLVVNANKTY